MMEMFKLASINNDILSSFVSGPESGLLIDFDASAVDNEILQNMDRVLPNDFLLQYLNLRIDESFSHLEKDLEQYMGQLTLRSVLAEVMLALALFYRVSLDESPFISLRVVTDQYLKNEHPSVSQYYHRDSAALTLTKTFVGKGACFIESDNVNRSFFEENSLAIDDHVAAYHPEQCRSVPDQKWLLLKGEIYQGMDERNMSFIKEVLGQGEEIKDCFKGQGLIHKGGDISKLERRLVFTVSSYHTKFLSQ